VSARLANRVVTPGRASTVLSTRWPWRIARLIIVLLLLSILVAGFLFARERSGEPSAIRVEFAGSDEALGEALSEPAKSAVDATAESNDPTPTCAPWPQQTEDCEEAADLARDGVNRDFVFIAAYVVSLALLCFLGSWASERRRWRRRIFLQSAGLATIVVAVLDLGENICLLHALEPTVESERWVRGAAVAATAKWGIVPLVAVGALWGLALLVRGRDDERVAEPAPALDRAEHWKVPAPVGSDANRFGVCLSGGGIRSASFCLGAVQRLEEGKSGAGDSFLKGADYLSAVSGGGYFAGAAQLLAKREGDPPHPFAAGSAEQDHLRRHANYLADTAGEWASALAQAFGKLLGNVLLLGLVVIAVAQPLGWMGRLLFGANADAADPSSWPQIPEAVWFAVALTGGIAILLANARRFQKTDTDGLPGALYWITTRVALLTGVGTGVVATTAVVLPLLDAVGRRAPEWLKVSDGSVGATWPTVLVVAALGWVTARALRREAAGGTAPEAGADDAAARKKFRLPFGGGIPELIAGPIVALVALGYIVALAAVARQSGPLGPAFLIGSFGIATLVVFAGATITVLVSGYSIDAVSWSMHRFYKRRLWSAFAYDPNRRGERSWSEPTTLSEDAAVIPGRPKLLLCAAAQVSGPDRAPPGRRAVTWTLDADHVGGPEIGWCETKDMEASMATKDLAGDVSMFGAMAISGAAFGSAMGRHSKGSINAVLAIANARLGVWLPNPSQIRDGEWKYRRRTLWYLVKEILGRYAADGRWMLVSDGGHVENLGLVELLRRRCHRIVCFDATGDDSGRASTIAEALRLAEEELGVVVEITNPWGAMPGSDDPAGVPKRLADELEGRMAKRPVLHGKITYPAESGLPSEHRTGYVVIGRAVLGNTVPWPVLSYAGGQTAFPNDPTLDQWYDHEQFTDYRLLGRWVADQVVRTTDDLPDWEWPAPA
jgi:hypothetical protein